MFSIGDYVKRTDLQNKIDLKILSEQELKFLQESILDIIEMSYLYAKRLALG